MRPPIATAIACRYTLFVHRKSSLPPLLLSFPVIIHRKTILPLRFARHCHCLSIYVVFAIASHLPLPWLIQTTSLHEIDVAVAALKVQKWTATLPFNGFLCKPADEVLMASFQDRHDLFSLTRTIYKGFIVRFDPQTFPVVPGGVAKNKASMKKLFDSLISIDKTQRQKQRWESCANRHLVCDRKNSRGPKGQSLPKRTSTSKATNSNETCKVKLAFDADSVSMFLVCGIGESQHEGHLPRNAIDMATRKRIVPAAAADFQKMSANHNIGPGKTAAMVEEEFGLHLSRRQVAQMQQMAKLADDLNNTDELASGQ
ncbi:hypothetical protein IV203_037056 [Nitzschia inconspicua]|uniref:Uncharacterized protein n=1 Tax=Nitzschia inconspicua TaxID=303405 RepID=A0A9K3LL80_9STRA|nr:hypothetical protein IV203_037056 [Nitzschia inconspicua]